MQTIHKGNGDMIKRVTLSIVTIVLVLAVAFGIFVGSILFYNGCTTPDSNYVGFEYFDRAGSIITAVKSESLYFDSDDATLEFYYGATDEISDVSGDRIIACLTTKEPKEYCYKEIPDYRKVEGLYIIEKKSVEELLYGPFDVEIPWGPDYGTQKFYHFKNTWTIPEEVFSEESGKLYFTVLFVRESETGDGTCELVIGPASGALIYLNYSKKKDNQIRILAELAQRNI